MQHPCPDMGTFSVRSDKLFRAVEACDWEPNIKITEKSVIISKGKTRIQLQSSPDYCIHKKRKGKKHAVPDNLFEKIKLVQPFISDDASRSWATSINVHNNHLYATNNITIVRTPINLPDCTIPIDLVEILLKIKELPTKINMGADSVVFTYASKAWLQGQLITIKWPAFTELFGRKCKMKKIPKNLLEAVQKIKHFTEDDIVRIEKKRVSTTHAYYDGIKMPDKNISCFHLEKVLNTFTHADFRGDLIHLEGDQIEGVMASTVMP